MADAKTVAYVEERLRQAAAGIGEATVTMMLRMQRPLLERIEQLQARADGLERQIKELEAAVKLPVING